MKKQTILTLTAIVAVLVAAIFAGCVEKEAPASTQAPTPTPTPTPVQTPTPTPVQTPTPTPVQTPTPTPVQTPTPTPVQTPTPTTGSISVSSSPSGANIYLDEGYQGTTPITLTKTAANSYTITLKLTGYQDWSQTIQVVAGATTYVYPNLIPPPDRIYGTFTYRGEPVEGMLVVLIASSECDINKVVQRTHTDAQGRYDFPGVGPGNFRIAINGWGGTGVPLEPYGQTCTWELEKTADNALPLNWTLHKTDLQITFPIDEATINSTSPTFCWKAYPDATRYEIVLIQVSPTRETIEWGTPTESASFTPAQPLISGARYHLLVWAWVSHEQIAVGSVYFGVQ